MTRSLPPVRVIALVSVLANVAFNALYSHLGLGLTDIRVLSDRYQSLFTPAPYAFAIWGLIYTALIAYAIFALLPSQRQVRLHDRIAWPFVIVNVLGSVWIAVFTSDHPATSVLVIAAMLATAILIERRVGIESATLRRPRLWLAPFSLLLGWLSVATIASVSEAAVAHGASPEDVPWAIVMLGVALVMGLLLAVPFADGVYLAVVCWAATALAIAQLPISPTFGAFAIGVAVVSGLASLAVWALLLVRRSGPGLPPHEVLPA